METLTHSTYHLVADHSIKRKSIWSRFISWCESQEENRFGWLAAAVVGHGCVITPITLLVIMLAGNSFVWWPMVMGAIAMSLIVNLAAMPTKVTIPVFFLSLLIDAVVIVGCFTTGLQATAVL